MKRFCTLYLCFIAFVVAMAQSLSYPTDTVKGKVYWLYPVQKSEGLYRISKNFGVPQEDIVAANPELEHSGLRLGQIIRIPYVEQIDSSRYIVHELQPKETLYGLSKRYQVKVEDIQNLNPVTAKRMNIGAKLLIPRAPEQPAADSTPLRNIPKEATNVASSALTEQVIVSQPESQPAMQEQIAQPAPAQPQQEKVDTLFSDTLFSDTVVQDTLSLAYQPTQTPLRIAFMLPLMTEVAKRDPAIDRFVEFYEGALLSVYAAQKSGQKFEIYVYDIEKNNVKLQRILQQPEMLNMDAIVGPAYPSQVSLLSQFAFANHIPVLVPFTSRVSDIDRNPYLLQFNPSEQMEAALVCDWLKQKGNNVHCLFIGLDADDAAQDVRTLYAQAQQQQLSLSTIPLHTLQNDSLADCLAKEKENILIFPYTRFASVHPLLAKAEPFGKQYSLSVFSYYAWQKEMLPFPAFYTSVFNTETMLNLPLMTYSLRYNRYFGHELTNTYPRYDLLGYDLTSWLVLFLQQDAELPMQQRIEQTRYKGLQSDILFLRKSAVGGYENQGLHILTR